MALWSWLFGKAHKQKSSPDVRCVEKFLDELCTDIAARYQVQPSREGGTSLEAVVEAGYLVAIDWADDPETVTDQFFSVFGDHSVTGEMMAAASEKGMAALTSKGARGAGTFPTILALDEAVLGSGHRLIWVDDGSDTYLIGLVSDAFHARWYDVSLSRDAKITSLAVTEENELSRNRKLADEPRSAAQNP